MSKQKRQYTKTMMITYSNGGKVGMKLRVPAYVNSIAIVRRAKLMVGITGVPCDRSDIGKRMVLQQKGNKNATLQIMRKVG